MPRPPVKKTRRLAEAAEEGKLRAQFKMSKKKPLDVSIKEHIGKFIDKIEMKDAIKLIEIGAIAYIIKPIIQTAPALVEGVKQHVYNAPEFLKGDLLNYFGIPPSIFGFEIYKPPSVILAQEVKDVSKAASLSEPIAWALSIGIACLIVEFGPLMLQSVGGLTTLAGLLIAV